MQAREAAVPRPPLAIRWLDPLVRRLLSIGMPMGPNTLLTVRGRVSGKPRTVGVAVVEIGERRWIVGAYGDVHWVRNLRVAGEGEIRLAGAPRRVRAEEYGALEAAAWIREVLAPHIGGLPFVTRIVSSLFSRELLGEPERAAASHPIFELHAM